MNLFDVYPRYDITPVKGTGSFIWDDNGNRFLDLYGGHAVLSIGHSHKHYMKRITEQLAKLAFYSNSVNLPIQDQLAAKLGQLSGYDDYALFLSNSGAEAAENAMKLASFHTGRSKVIAFQKGFHGRTSLALEATDDDKNLAPVNQSGHVIKLPFNDLEAVNDVIDESIAGVIVEGIQGIGGIYEASESFLLGLQKLCKENGSVLILDEIQSGYGRSGKFFAHQFAGVKPDIITVAKGMGNGFPIGGTIISPQIEPWMGMLGTTYGGNPLACAAALGVLEVLEKEDLIENANELGKYLKEELSHIDAIKEVRGKGLMIGIELEGSSKEIRKELLFKHQIFTGTSSNPNTLRILPPLSVTKEELSLFIEAIKEVFS